MIYEASEFWGFYIRVTMGSWQPPRFRVSEDLMEPSGQGHSVTSVRTYNTKLWLVFPYGTASP